LSLQVDGQKGFRRESRNWFLINADFSSEAGSPGIPSEANQRILDGIHFATPSMSGMAISFGVTLVFEPT
jgi:hypothetical protein